MSNNKASSNNESIILTSQFCRREDSSEVYGTGDERIINRTITIQAAIKSTLPDYLYFITELAVGACFFASSNEYMKVNKKTKESIIIIRLKGSLFQ